jgi:2-keto-3-deoxy-galactonokinase
VFPPEAGPEIVDGNESSLRFTVGKGDTVIVEARRGIDGPSYLNTNGSEPVLNATVALDGRPLQNVTGTQFSTAEPGAPLKFSFTPR